MRRFVVSRTAWLIVAAAGLLPGAGLPGVAEAQVLYNVLTTSGERLRQVNPDGSNNIPIQVGNLPQNANPMVSGDGRLLSVRSQDPGRPNQFSSNVHVFDSSNGQLTKITNFEDATDPQTGATFNHSPRFTSFSPDGSMLVVSDFLNTQTAGQGSSTTNFTSIHRTSDGALLDGPAVIGSAGAQSTVGVGVSWSPANNRIAIPAVVPNGATGIVSGNSLLNIPARQETFPQVGLIAGGGNFVEEDSFPTYSPNGQALAYFRSRDILTFGGNQPSALSLWVTSSNGDRVFSFNPGFQPTGLAWSPDGTQLAAGVGPQLSSGGVLFNLADPANAEVLIFNVSAGAIGFDRVLASPGFSPTWSSLAQAGVSGDFNGSGQVEQGDLDLVLQNWGRDTTSAGVPNGWVNDLPSGQIEQSELDGVLQNWGSAASPNVAPTPGVVPEPAGSLMLAGVGLLTRRRPCRGVQCRLG